MGSTYIPFFWFRQRYKINYSVILEKLKLHKKVKNERKEIVRLI